MWAHNNDLLLFLEMKDPFRYPNIEKQVADMIHKHDLVERVQVRSFFHAHLLQLHKIAPEISISELWLNHLPWRGEIIFSTINLRYGLFSQQNIAEIHDWGRSVTTWVVDDLDAGRQLRDWELDGITTNNPGHLLRIFSAGA